jgi:N utilization substance protein A
VDETLAQLLASDGFATVEEVAYVDPREISTIEGLDEQTADELQNRAREYLERETAELDAKRVELGVLDEMKEIEGLTPQMLVALGEADIKSVEDLAGCATDDLVGWTERKPTGAVKHKGALSDLEVTADEANALIMRARVWAGWIEPEPETEDEEGADIDSTGENGEVEA